MIDYEHTVSLAILNTSFIMQVRIEHWKCFINFAGNHPKIITHILTCGKN